MSETPRFSLPLLAPSQAQKHVTVNEALVRLDALGQLALASRTAATPPAAAEGDVYAVPAGATGDWTGQEGKLALFLGGGWDFATPDEGWRAWVLDEACPAICRGGAWHAAGVSVSASGAGATALSAEEDHVISAGATSTTSALIPAGAIVLGVTGRVLATITGTLSSFRIGIAGISEDRYGGGIGLPAGATMRGVTDQPQAYHAAKALTLTGEGGDFAGGTVRLAVHYVTLSLPSA